MSYQSAVLRFFLHQTAAGGSQHFSAYLRFYEAQASSLSIPKLSSDDNASVVDKDDIIHRVAKTIREQTVGTRRQIEYDMSELLQWKPEIIERALRMTVRVGFMLDIAIKEEWTTMAWTPAYIPQHWKLDSSFEDFVRASIPHHSVGSVFSQDSRRVRAWKLKKRCKVRIEKTDNLANHLVYDPETRTLQVFHQIAYLLAQLDLFEKPVPKVSLSQSLHLGTLPPDLILETLITFYEILFPLTIDDKGRSLRLLEKLIEKKGFDPEARWRFGEHSSWIGEDFRFHYWNERLTKLVSLIETPPATSAWVSWLDRHSRNRNALIIAIAGLFLSAFFGLLGVLVGIAQLVVAIETWRWPGSDG